MRASSFVLASSALALVALAACGGRSRPASFGASVGGAASAAAVDDQSKCDWRGRTDREVSETSGPGSVVPNVRRVYQTIGTASDSHKVLVCREIDTNFDGIKDIVRTYNEKGESLREEADTNYDGKVDTWVTFATGRISKEQLDTDFDGQPDSWKYYVGGALSRIQRDTNKDGKPDRWEFYADGKLERVGVDVDFDGHVERWDHDELARAASEDAEKSSGQAKSGGDAGAGVGPAGPSTDADAGADDAGTKSKRLAAEREKKSDGGAADAAHD